jgi:hypothetical protein
VSTELDALVAEYICGGVHGLYSTNIAHAFQVVDAMKQKGWAVLIANNPCAPGQNAVKFVRGALVLGRSLFDGEATRGHYAVADTFPRAICEAATQTVKMEAVL